MRKIFFFLLISALTFTTSAQTAKSRCNWGLKSGLNISTLRTDANSENDWKTGLVLGAYFKFKAGNNFMIQPEFLYSSLGGRLATIGSGETRYRLNYFSIPVLANIKIAKNISVVAGPEADFLIQAKRGNDGNYSKSTGDFRDASFGLTGGFEFWPIQQVGFSARYHHGFSNVADDESGSLRNMELKNQAVQLTVAVRL